jgi:hypothetical protein
MGRLIETNADVHGPPFVANSRVWPPDRQVLRSALDSDAIHYVRRRRTAR